MEIKKIFLFVFAASALFFLAENAHAGTPTYMFGTMDVYESSTRALGDGTSFCTDVDLSGTGSCGEFVVGNTYQFEVTVINGGDGAGDLDTFDWQNIIASGDFLNSATGTLCGCDLAGVDKPGTLGTTATDYTCTGFTTSNKCSIAKNGESNVFYYIVTIPSGAQDDAINSFYVATGAVTRTSGAVNYTVFSNSLPTLDITVPDGGESWTSSPKDINFTVTDADCATKACDLNVGLWYSTSQGAYTNAIDIDLNVMDSADISCGGDYDFTNGSNCAYSWTISGINDGTYFIDAQLYDGTDLNYNSSNASFTIDLPPSMTNGYHDGNVLHDRNVMFHADCTNTGDNWTIYVCDTSDIQACALSTPLCGGVFGTDSNPDCNVTATCGALYDNQVAYVGCCDDGFKCDTDYYTTTFSISDEIIFSFNDGFGFNTYTPADDTSKTACELDYFDVNGIESYCNILITDANMEVYANGELVCFDDSGDTETGSNITAGYSCSAAMSIANYDWHIDVNAPNTANTEGNTTLNIEVDRNYVVKNDEFSYTVWEPPNNATYDSGVLIDFNVTGLVNSCGTVINDARFAMRDSTENVEICQDSTGSSGFYLCSLDAGTAPLDETTETIYASITKAGYDDSNSATRTLNLNLTDLTFAMSYPSSGCSDTNGCYGGGCSACTYCAFYSNGTDQNEVNCSGQTVLTPFYAYDNQSSSTNQTWTMDLNANITGTGLWHKVSTGSGGYEAVCTNSAPPPTNQCVYVMTTDAVQIGTDITPAGDKNAWAWADFVNMGAGTTDRNVTSTSAAS